MGTYQPTARSSFIAVAICFFLTVAVSASASRPSPTWQNAKNIAVHCVVGTENSGYNQALSDATCAQIAKLVASDAPIPVKVVGFGDVALSSPETVILAVHATVVGRRKARSLIFTIRPSRHLPDHPPELFGSVPRLAPLRSAEGAIKLSLLEILPWKYKRLDARPIR